MTAQASTSTPFSRKIILTLATKDIGLARAFYTALGFTENEQFSGENCVCIVMSETISAMFMAESQFANFSPKPVCDTSKSLEVLISLTCRSRTEVDETIQKALTAGGSVFEDAEDHGAMYMHSFIDPDGHGWNLIHMEETA
jgi:predicted lactoylglutathione lyase